MSIQRYNHYSFQRKIIIKVQKEITQQAYDVVSTLFQRQNNVIFIAFLSKENHDKDTIKEHSTSIRRRFYVIPTPIQHFVALLLKTKS